MNKWMIRQPRMYKRMREASFSPGIGFTLIIMLFMYGFYYIIREIPAVILDTHYYANQTITPQNYKQVVIGYLTAQRTMIIALFLTGLLIAVTIFFVRRIEKRPLSTIGISRNNAVRRYVVGFSLGFLLLAVSAIPELLSRKVTYDGLSQVILLFLAAFMVQAASEEVFFRGYMLSSITRKAGPLRAVLISSALFAMLHLKNYGMTVLSMVDIFLAGVLYAFLVLRTNSLWSACGLHAAWNFALGLVSPTVYGWLVTSYAVISAERVMPAHQSVIGSLDILVPIGLQIILIVLVLFAGKNRLVIRRTEAVRMYIIALKIAKKAQKGRCGPNGRPLVKHSVKVSEMVEGDNERIVALLHDVWEYSGITPKEIALVGFSDSVAAATDAITKRIGESDAAYMCRVRKNPVALTVKKAEIMHIDMMRVEQARRGKKKKAEADNGVFCPLLRKSINMTDCAEIIQVVDGVTQMPENSLMHTLDHDICKRCAIRDSAVV